MNKNKKLLDSFAKRCKENPSERFWQALRNWSEYDSILGAFNNKNLEDPIYNECQTCQDTFYKET